MIKSIKVSAIFKGFLSFLLGSIIWTFIMLILIMPFVDYSKKDTFGWYFIWILNLIIAIILIFRSGIVSAIQAKTNENIHALIVALIAIIYSFAWQQKTPMWFWSLYVISMIPFAIAGSNIIKKKKGQLKKEAYKSP